MTQHVFSSKTKWRHQTAMFQLPSVQFGGVASFPSGRGVFQTVSHFLNYRQFNLSFLPAPRKTARKVRSEDFEDDYQPGESEHISILMFNKLFLIYFTYLCAFEQVTLWEYKCYSSFFRSVSGSLANLWHQRFAGRCKLTNRGLNELLLHTTGLFCHFLHVATS